MSEIHGCKQTARKEVGSIFTLRNEKKRRHYIYISLHEHANVSVQVRWRMCLRPSKFVTRQRGYYRAPFNTHTSFSSFIPSRMVTREDETT